MRILRKWLIGAGVSLLTLIVLLAVAVYLPPVQSYAVRQVAAIASASTGMDISVERVRLTFPLDLCVEGVSVIDGDTLAHIGRAQVGVALLPLLRGQVVADELRLQMVQFDTGALISSLSIRGRADALRLKNSVVDLRAKTVSVDDLSLATAAVDICLADTLCEDSTAEAAAIPWQIAVQQLALTNTDVSFRMAHDSLCATAALTRVSATQGIIDLHEGRYTVATAALSGALCYDRPFAPKANGFDYNHLSLSDVALSADAIEYSPSLFALHLRAGRFAEAQGLTLTRLNGEVRLDSTTLSIPSLALATPSSSLSVEGSMALNAFDDEGGALALRAEGSLGRSDVLLFLPALPPALTAAYPYQPLTLCADVYGSLQHLTLRTLRAALPTAFDVALSGQAENVLDGSRLTADLAVQLAVQDVSFLTAAFFGSAPPLAIPPGTALTGELTANAGVYSAALQVEQGGGSLTLDGTATYPNISYSAAVAAAAFPLQHFIPSLALSPLTLTATIGGSGTDLFDSATTLQGALTLEECTLADIALAETHAELSLAQGAASVALTTASDPLAGALTAHALLQSDGIKGTLESTVDHLDLRALGVGDEWQEIDSLCCALRFESDLRQTHALRGTVSNASPAASADNALTLDAFTRPDSTALALASGDLSLRLTTSGGYMLLAQVGSALSSELQRQVERKYISQDTLQRLLPTGQLTLRAGRDNFAYGYVKRLGYDFLSLAAAFSSSPTEGINGTATIESLDAEGIQVDTLRLTLTTDDSFNYSLYARNSDKEQYNFLLCADGSLFATGGTLRATLCDATGAVGVDLALKAALVRDGILVSLTDDEAVVGYQTFTASEGNYIFVSDEGRIAANLLLAAADGTGVSIYTNDEDSAAQQDITLAINSLNLAPIVAVIPFCPAIKGVLSAEGHVVQTAAALAVAATVAVDAFEYEGIDMGDLAAEVVYMPLENDAHFLDGALTHNGAEVCTLQGTYTLADAGDYLAAEVRLHHLPLSLANGFIPDMIVGMKGYGDGALTIDGTLAAPQINGTLDLDSAYLVSVPYGIELKIDEKPVEIKDSKVLLNDFKLYSHNDEPLVVNGEVDCSDIANMATSLRMTATNWLVVDAKENKKSEAFGKAYVNLDATATGPLAAMTISGSVEVLGSTNLTYVLRDSPLSTDNAMEGLVQFVDLTEEETIITRPAVEGPYIDLRLTVASQAHVFVALNAIKTNYIDMTGGGEMRMIYSSNDIRLTGRYTIEEGEMKYSLPVIPLKTFTIAEGSYVEFTGELMNPTLSIIATETTKSNAMVNGVSQSVTFNCGVAISQTLENMGLEFIVEAPENTTINSELQAMASDERSKIAVTLLTTGMYLTDNNLSSFSMNSALSAFLQNEINNISNNALRTLDLSIGIDNTTDATGDTHTDYTFKFAKRLWNNRVRLVIGGKVSSNNASVENLFDNVAVEYRLDKNAYTNLRLFYDRSTYDYLEGYVGQYGAGIIWKRQLQSFRELFHRHKDAAPADTLTVAREGSDE